MSVKFRKKTNNKNHYKRKFHYDQSYLIALHIQEIFEKILEKENMLEGQRINIGYSNEKNKWLIESIEALKNYCEWIEHNRANVLKQLHDEGIEIKKVIELVELKEKRLITKLKTIFHNKFFAELYRH